MARDNIQKMRDKLRARHRKEAGLVIADFTEGYKMSDVLAAFAEPFLQECGADTEQEIRMAYSIVICAWNMSLLPPHERIRLLMPTMQLIPVEERHFFKNIIADMIKRKESEFGEYQRWIVDFELSVTRDKISLSVLSSPSPDREKAFLAQLEK